MKRIYICIAIVCAISCSSFLDKGPEENLTVEDLFANRNYARGFLTHTYSWTPTEANMMDNGGSWRNPYVAGSDEMECAFGGAYGHLINDGSWSPQNISQTQVWPESYMALRKVNMFLERINGLLAADPNATETEVRHWTGEMYFLRAWYHFLVFRAYGPVPIADHCMNPEDNLLSIVRSPADEVVKFICDDCDRAVEYLYDKDVWESNETGRATPLAALALKARALLYIASPLYNGNTDQADLKNLDGTPLISQTYDKERWKTAADAAKACIDRCLSAGKKLFNEYPDPVVNYTHIFTDLWNSEVIWAKNINTYEHWLNCADPISFGCYSILDPTQELVDAYEMEDGSTPILGYSDNDHLLPIINPASGYVETGYAIAADPAGRWQAGVRNMYTHREPRFYASINFNGAIWKTNAPNYNADDPHTLAFHYEGIDGKKGAGSDYCKTGYLMRKLVSPDRVPGKYTPQQQWIYIRLTELYLNYAEALNEYSGPVKDVYDYVNAVRNRAGLPDLPAGLSQSEMRDRIKHERRIELAFETHRFFDTRRWKDAEKNQGGPCTGMNIYAGTSQQDDAFYQRTLIETRVFKVPKHYFFPIAQVEIEKHSDRALVQNLGWTTEIDAAEQ